MRDNISRFSLLMQLSFSGIGFDSHFLFSLELSKCQLWASYEQVSVTKCWVMGEGFQCLSSTCTHESHFQSCNPPTNFSEETWRGSRDSGCGIKPAKLFGICSCLSFSLEAILSGQWVLRAFILLVSSHFYPPPIPVTPEHAPAMQWVH